jgi:hypothetical protein
VDQVAASSIEVKEDHHVATAKPNPSATTASARENAVGRRSGRKSAASVGLAQVAVPVTLSPAGGQTQGRLSKRGRASEAAAEVEAMKEGVKKRRRGAPIEDQSDEPTQLYLPVPSEVISGTVMP